MSLLERIKKNIFYKFFTNIFVMILIPFIIWMIFFDENSFLIHKRFDKEIEELENSVNFYKDKIEEDKNTIKKLQDSLELERFAREQYLMKKENEEIYLIEFDTIPKK
ncbi:MAG: septum formation initiator [Flavobacteriia bacterium]|nr:septum formation initiator [Flavobacteriia bacterium]OIP46742.1 MAG: septum formation initiator [Flavobacteriaceae bacterium CG2_30_31_66]PIV95799.1 MAG: septum formation initiator [Flavobacteriaceae bacterium CG17_big_fil_post_rev_8_21_14_2_50_31_13]PIX13226.1 MAG: septum formation initiator [Flavobacteriaceae bacterium CG_4_8_14_3_um_filter_31_8]PIY16132.1 MAG: septum formation initiator [Flavobacteriaceae bacterium CG_4_10_14_3_um_filter_31_253]PIZ11315.1 MAG: septum formation initiator 